MTMKFIDVAFNGGMKIDAILHPPVTPAGPDTPAPASTVIRTDQPVKDGGEGTAPTPFELFLASLATCAGVYAQRFCEARKISTEGLGIRVGCEFAPKGFQVTRMTFVVTPPQGFPDEYRDALVRAVELCAVKKHIMTPPAFEVVLA
ncbi:OsmC family protein [Nitratidesulfovibrio sp. SRB-5]|uniref:OsmC family protein n=1 Tax=Nitratidesulfovibrio sp. SRB-5 TaxID=2872636 RepID=UPI001027D0EA|nr:OsmC family protein [Nitratidesulfovibrio sp. SRB-5]MBZ2171355.1 OsmC family protein [Nitratidesulfovibrio sp. SRB-5]RXF77579.1 osmotically inducible protein OsmC [Desulfovibrio sp. DS-1]